MTTHHCEDCQKVHQLLSEFHENYREVPVIQSIVKQLKQAMPKKASRSPTEAPSNYVELIGILPYSLWPSML